MRILIQNMITLAYFVQSSSNRQCHSGPKLAGCIRFTLLSYFILLGHIVLLNHKKKKRKKVQLKMWVWLNSENKMHIVGSMWVWVDWKNKIHIVYSNNLERKFWLGWFFLHEENNRIRLIIYEKSPNYSWNIIGPLFPIKSFLNCGNSCSCLEKQWSNICCSCGLSILEGDCYFIF